MLLGWTACFAVAVAVALVGRVSVTVRVGAVMAAALAAAAILASVGTMLLAAAVFAWGVWSASRVRRAIDAPQASTAAPTADRLPARPGAARLPVASPPPERAAAMRWAPRFAVVGAWLILGFVGIGTIVRLYVTFGADLSLHPTFGASAHVFRGLFVQHAVLVMLVGLALVSRVFVSGAFSRRARAPSALDAERFHDRSRGTAVDEGRAR
jgi:hypothetical protein